MDKITSIHDTFVRAILADKEIAMDYFHACLSDYVACIREEMENEK